MPIGGIKCAVFDLDDTLWNTMQTLERAHQVMQAALQLRRPEVACGPEVVKEAMLQVMADQPARKHDYSFCRREALKKMTGDAALSEEVFQTWHAARNRPELFPGALEALGRLKQHVSIGTLTDGNGDPFVIPGLKALVDFHVSAAEAGAGKPDLRAFQLCEAKSGCTPGELVMVGDNPAKDVQGAKDAGWRAIWVRPPAVAISGSAFDVSQGAAQPAPADAEVDHVREVESILLRWAQSSL
ncbi:unnamed protein product [Effrenium voratum]|uniref:HAD family hydrolase n=1 Tax=Effrenium voratum TaxID=2562239 RepID=A0AA36JNY4_9DINO|nr:unnamed protein product [Effrenium voratum]